MCYHAQSMRLKKSAALHVLARASLDSWYAGWICYQAGRYKEVRCHFVNSSVPAASRTVQEGSKTACTGVALHVLASAFLVSR
jgi:hypothetical protein